MSEIRYNRLQDSYVIISPERMRRPDYMSWSKEEESSSICPFCEGKESMTPNEIFSIRDKGSFADEKGWLTRVVPNLYKAVQIEAPYQLKNVGTNKVWDGFGAHEIIIDTPKHLSSISEFSSVDIFNWLKTIEARVSDLRKDKRIAYISIFKNQGQSAGATQSHPHTQLIGLPIVPKEIEHKYERIHHYYMDSGRALMDDIIDEEKREGERVIRETDSFIAFCPFASEYPFEVIITSESLSAEIDKIEDEKLEELSTLLKELFATMNLQLGNFDFNMSLSVPPMQKYFYVDANIDHKSTTCRFEIRIIPRIYKHGSFELFTGTMINPIEPEYCAKLLRSSFEKI